MPSKPPVNTSQKWKLLGGVVTWIGTIIIAILFYKYFDKHSDNQDNSLKISKDTLEFTTKAKTIPSSRLQQSDPSLFFSDSTDGFRFLRLKEGVWNGPESLSTNDATRAVLHIENTRVTLDQVFPSGPPHDIFVAIRAIRFTSGDPVVVQFKETSANATVEATLDRHKQEADAQKATFDRAADLRKFWADNGLPPNRTFKNAFVIASFDRSIAKSLHLPEFFSMAPPEGSFDAIAMDASSEKGFILITGVEDWHDVLVNDKDGDLHVGRVKLYRESKNHFYIADFTYIKNVTSSEAIGDVQRAIDNFEVDQQ
jgi:hypothetical protein